MPERLKKLYLPVLCWGLLGVYAARHLQFSSESSDFEAVVKRVQPGNRAVYLALDTASGIPGNPFAYLHYALWYQVDLKGFVDPNFAWLMPQIVRFKDGSYPSVFTNFNEVGDRFDWVKNQGSLYRYFFVRSTANPPADLFVNAQCRVVIMTKTGRWSVYERQECR